MQHNFPVINGAKPTGRDWLKVKNDASAAAAEILIYDFIGKDPWDDSGIADKEFADALKAIPANREITVRINSQGGSVKDGLAIYNQLSARKQYVTAIVDGYALSTASWIALAGKKVVMPENGSMMIHNPMLAYTGGDAKALRKDAEMLDTIKAQIVSMYRAKTGKSDAAISDAMDAETWFTAAEAKAWGLADEITKPVEITNHFDLSAFRRVPASVAGNSVKLNTPAAQPAPGQIDNSMNKEKIIAILKANGVEVANDATNEWLETALAGLVTNLSKQAKAAPATTPSDPANATIVAVQNALKLAQDELKAIKDAREQERVARITNAVDKAISEGRITNEQKDKWVKAICADETMLIALNAIKPVQVGYEGVGVRVVAEDIRDLENQIVKNLGFNISEPDRPVRRAALIAKNRPRLMEVVNTNTVSADLKRVVILDAMVRAFAKRLLPLSVFSTVFSSVPLAGTDEVVVPYFALDTTTSTDFVAANGYDTFGNTNNDSRKIAINKRKYQALSFTSAEFRRQPYLNVTQVALLKAEALASDVFADVLSVVTNANYGAAAITKLASAFGPDDVADLRTVCNQANWPKTGRGLILDSAYDGSLVKDAAIRAVLSSGMDTLKTGAIPELYGFAYYENNNIPGNSENLVGFASFTSAALVATSPVIPGPSVREKLSRYEIVTDPQTGISFEWRVWGDADKDTTREVVECNYGYLKGEAAAIKRIVSA